MLIDAYCKKRGLRLTYSFSTYLYKRLCPSIGPSMGQAFLKYPGNGDPWKPVELVEIQEKSRKFNKIQENSTKFKKIQQNLVDASLFELNLFRS